MPHAPDLPTAVLASESHGIPPLVADMLVVLGAAAVICVLLKRLHLASIPGYLLVGALIGAVSPTFHLIQDADNVAQIGEIAIILLMFTIGLHLDLDAIRSGMVPILIVGAAATALSALVMWPMGLPFGLSAPAALAVAMALSMSSTAVVLGILQQRKEVHLLHGRLCIGIAIMQDMLSIAVLAALPVLAVWAGVDQAGAGSAGTTETPAWVTLIANACLALGGIVAMLAFARYVLPHLLREASRGGNTEGLLVASAGAGLAAAVLTAALGFGPALGAFLAGFMLSSTPFRYQLAGQLSPMRDLFMAVFFTAVGIQLDVVAVAQSWWIIALAVGLVMAAKALVIGGSIWSGGAPATVAALAGALLSQAGEFSIVILNQAQSKGIVTERTTGVVTAVVVISLILTTPAANYARRKQPRLARIRPARWFATKSLREHHAPLAHTPVAASLTVLPGMTPVAAPQPAAPPPPPPPPPPTPQRHVIIAGFGIVGRNLAEHLAAAAIPYSVVELNPSTVNRQQALGRQTFYGDITNPDVLESAGLAHAEAVMLTIPDDEATLRACETIRAIRPDIFIAARTSYLSRAIAAHELGADHVTIEEVVTAQDMAVKVMAELRKRYKAREEAVPHL